MSKEWASVSELPPQPGTRDRSALALDQSGRYFAGRPPIPRLRPWWPRRVAPDSFADTADGKGIGRPIRQPQHCARSRCAAASPNVGPSKHHHPSSPQRAAAPGGDGGGDRPSPEQVGSQTVSRIPDGSRTVSRRTGALRLPVSPSCRRAGIPGDHTARLHAAAPHAVALHSALRRRWAPGGFGQPEASVRGRSSSMTSGPAAGVVATARPLPIAPPRRRRGRDGFASPPASRIRHLLPESALSASPVTIDRRCGPARPSRNAGSRRVRCPECAQVADLDASGREPSVR